MSLGKDEAFMFMPAAFSRLPAKVNQAAGGPSLAAFSAGVYPAQMLKPLKKKIAIHAGKIVAKDALAGTQSHLRRRGPSYEAQLAAVAAIASALACGLRAWRHLDSRKGA